MIKQTKASNLNDRNKKNRTANKYRRRHIKFSRKSLFHNEFKKRDLKLSTHVEGK